MFWRLDLVTCWRLTSVAKNACLANIRAVFKSFSVFPRTYCDCSLSFLSETSQTHYVTHFQLHCCFISSQNHQEKVWVLFSSSHILCLMNVFRAIWVDTILETFFSWFDGYGWLCLLLLSSVFILLVTLCFFFVLLFACWWFSNSFVKWVWYFCDLLFSLVCVLMLACGFGLLCFMLTYRVWWHLQNIPLKQLHFLNVVSHCHVLYFGYSDPSFWNFMPVLSYVVCFMLSVLNAWMLSFYAYHGHGRLSHWQLFLNLCLFMLYCTFTILLHLSYCAL